MKIVSHTLVKHGMPFIGVVIRQVIPYMNRCLITRSENSDIMTIVELERLKLEFPDKVFISVETVSNMSELTKERQEQVDMTTEDWILFLDDDDWWEKDALEEMIGRLNNDLDGLAVSPYQIVDGKYYDANFNSKFYTKFFRNQEGLHYQSPFPRDMIWVNNRLIYWKVNPKVPKVGTRYFHLSNIKENSFRLNFKEYIYPSPELRLYPKEVIKTVEKIFSYVKH